MAELSSILTSLKKNVVFNLKILAFFQHHIISSVSLLWGRGVVKCWQLFTRVSAQTKTLIACNRLSQSNRSPLNTERPCCDSPRAWLLMNGKSYFVLAPGICSSQFSGRGFASWLVKKMKKKKERLATTSITWLLCWRKPRILSLSLFTLSCIWFDLPWLSTNHAPETSAPPASLVINPTSQINVIEVH